MRIVALVTGVAGLAGLLLYQVNLRSSGHFDVLIPGKTLELDPLDGKSRDRLAEQKGCTVVWVMDPHCGSCKRLAEAQADRLKDMPGFFWLMAGPRTAVDSFVTQYQLPAQQVLRADAHMWGKHPLRSLGVTATPTRVIAYPPSMSVYEVKVLNADLWKSPEGVELDTCDAAK